MKRIVVGAEEPLPLGGSCLLGSFNLSEYIKHGEFQFDEFSKDIDIVVRAMNDVLDEGLPLHPLQIQRDTVRDLRQIGIGMFGLHDMLIKMGLKYDTDVAIDICNGIASTLASHSIHSSALLAKEKGAFPKCNIDSILKSPYIKENASKETLDLIEIYGLRNSQILTIAPCGSLATMLDVSSGIEPMFALEYTRKTESLHGEDVYYKVNPKVVREYMDKHNITDKDDLPPMFVVSQNINPLKRIQMQSVWQKHIDASISSTINLPEETTVEEVENLYIEAWKHGLKGLTIYRNNCNRQGVLTIDDKKEEKEEVAKEPKLQRGQWEQKPKGTIEVARKVYSGCGKELLHITISPKEKRIIDFYITSSSTGGCKLNLQANAISMSAVLRVGGKLDNLVCAYRGMGVCPSFAIARAKGKHVSKGTSCATAILNVLLEVQKELEEERLEELQELGFYDNKLFSKIDINKEGVISMVIGKTESKPNFTEEELQYIKDNGETEFALSTNKCPQCAEPLQRTNGCISCVNCGYSKCN